MTLLKKKSKSKYSCLVFKGQQMGPSHFLLLTLLIFSIQNIFCCRTPNPSPSVVNVDDYGAHGDGATDDSEAFEKAWKKACSSHVPAILEVPKNRNYLLKPLFFSGPCMSDVTIMIKGTIEAPSNILDWDGGSTRHWILFHNVKNLFVTGGGTINGNGQIWWKNSCKINPTLPCTVAPTALTFIDCTDLRIEYLRIKNSQQIHVSIEKCKNVVASKLSISAPERSPNTDGIHVANTKNVIIDNCYIRTGDDCISIVAGSRNVKGMNIFCGPGHGISVGSLGANNSRDFVRNVIMDTITLHGTTNGVRIKTWQGGQGYAKNVVFQNIHMQNVHNPIIIDQNYCDSKYPCQEQKHAVEINRVTYKHIKGTSASDVSVRFDCSRHFPCSGIMLQDINLVGENGARTKSICKYVNWMGSGNLLPPPCEHSET